MTLLPALLAIVGTRIDALGDPPGTLPSDDPNGPWARLARWVMRRPVAVLVPTLALLLVLGWPFLHVRFNAPDSTILPASVPSRAAFDLLAATFGEGEFAPLTLAIRTTGPATSPDEPRGALRLLAAARGGPADQPRREPRRRRPAADASTSTSCCTATPTARRDRFIAMALAATTKGDLTAFTVFTPYGPNRAEGRALVGRPPGPGRVARSAAGHDRPRRRRRRGRRPTSSTASPPTSRGRRCSSS